MQNPKIQFLGAAGTVTGSRFLLSHGKTKVLVDCGLFQGLKELRLRNWKPLPIDAAEVDAVVLTHAHLDHCGYIPRLVKEGFRGKIYATKYTTKLADIILRDSARIQEEDAKYAAKEGFSKHSPPAPLYTEQDAALALQHFKPEAFHERIKVAEDTYVTFYPAGHILGAAFVEVEFFGKRLLFTGDMGRDEHPLLCQPDQIPSGKFDAIVTESTYGDREHVAETSNFEDVINQTIKRGGSVLIPAFAVDRTEVILVRLRELIEQGKIPQVPIFADSPMALRALAHYREAIDGNSPEIRDEIVAEWAGRDPFDPGTLSELMTVEQSKSINKPTSPCIIISASGMATGGRVVHHLKEMLPNQLHSVILVGFQAIGTRGRRLVEGEEQVKMHGQMIDVKAQIEQINSFSVHADADEMIGWLAVASEAPKRIFVVHGEAGAADIFADRIKGDLNWDAIAPGDGEAFDL